MGPTMPPRPLTPDCVQGPTDRPARPSLAPPWWDEEQQVLHALTGLTATLGPWDAARLLFGEQPRRRIARTVTPALRSAVDAISAAWRQSKPRPSTEHPPREPQKPQGAPE